MEGDFQMINVVESKFVITKTLTMYDCKFCYKLEDWHRSNWN